MRVWAEVARAVGQLGAIAAVATAACGGPAAAPAHPGGDGTVADAIAFDLDAWSPDAEGTAAPSGRAAPEVRAIDGDAGGRAADSAVDDLDAAAVDPAPIATDGAGEQGDGDAGDTEGPAPTDGAPADAVVDTGEVQGGDAAEPDGTAADGPAPDAAPADVAIGATVAQVTFALESSVAGLAGKVAVYRLDADATLEDMSIAPGDLPPPVALGDVTLPAKLSGAVPAGTWKFAAMVTGSKGFPIAGAVSCSAGQPAPVVVPGGAAVTVVLQVSLVSGPGSLATLCAASAPGPPQALFTTLDLVFTPTLPSGAAHFMHALVDGERVWIAGSQDGLVSFDFAPSPAANKPLYGWSVHGGAMCNRLARHGTTLYCSSRQGYLHAFGVGSDLTPGAPAKSWLDQVAPPGTEGMAIAGGKLWIAVFGKGIMAVPLSLDAAPQAFLAPGGAAVWEVRALANGLIAAGGDGALWTFDPALALQGKPPWLGALAWDGIAAHLTPDGTLLWVGDLTGSVAAVDLAVPAAPALVAKIALPDSVFGLIRHQGLTIAAAGHHMVALSLLPSQPPAIAVVGVLRSPRYAQDVQTLAADTIATAEFQAVRRIQIAPGLAKAGAHLITAPTASVPVVSQGGAIAGSLLVHNAGAAPLHVTGLTFSEAKGVAAVDLAVTVTIAVGQAAAVPFSFAKTVKGVADHGLVVHSDAAGGDVPVAIGESTWLQLGQPLPDLAFADLAGTEWKLSKIAAGKPLVVIVAAQSCPVAFMALAAAARQLAPLIAKGQIAAVAINPWDKPGAPELPLLPLPFKMLHSPLTTNDNNQASGVIDVTLGQPNGFGPPMPIVYVTGADGAIVYRSWGWSPRAVAFALAGLGLSP